jgi:prepilin-type N-terminal cleavage/methylation domain-containing protein
MDIIEKHRANRVGFSLLELLVVISVMGVVTGIGVRTFFGMASAWNDLKSMADLDRIAYSAFQEMQEDFADVVSAELSGVPIRGLTREHKYDLLLASYQDDQIVLPTQTSVVGERNLAGGSVRYHVARDGAEGTHHLVRYAGVLTAESPVDLPKLIIDNANVLSLRFEFLVEEESLGGDAGGWQLGWDSLGLPAAVRVSLTLADANRTDLQVSRKMVFPIHVR